MNGDLFEEVQKGTTHSQKWVQLNNGLFVEVQTFPGRYKRFRRSYEWVKMNGDLFEDVQKISKGTND